MRNSMTSSAVPPPSNLISMTIEQFKEYQAQVLKLESPISAISTQSDRFCHAVLGLVSEIGELRGARDQTHAFEELGDIMYYIALGCAVMEVEPDLSEFVTLDSHEAVAELELATADLADQAKRLRYYGTSLSTDNKSLLTNCFSQLVNALATLADEVTSGKTLSDIADGNIRKLKARYPEKFTLKDCENRNVTSEYAAMTAQ